MAQETARLAAFAAEISPQSIPHEVRTRASWLVLDACGIAIRARHDADSTGPLMAALGRLGYGAADGAGATVLGGAEMLSPPGAAFANGTLAHSLDFDDTHAPASLHPSAPIAPAAFAAAEMRSGAGTGNGQLVDGEPVDGAPVDGATVLAAIIAGYEIQIRLSLALDPSDHYAQGFHPTATCGAFGATAAAGRVLGLDADQMTSAFGIVLSQAAGTMQFLEDGAWTKRSHVGQAAMNGLIAASLAAEGFQGPIEAIEGRRGFLHAYAPASDPAKAADALGARWETMSIGIKPYPACRYSHAALDALIALRAEHGLKADEIRRVEIGLPETGWRIIGEPPERKQLPETVVDGQFSMPFCAAVALREGRLTWDDYKPHLSDPATLALCKKILPVIDAEADAAFPEDMAGKVTIETDRGTFGAFVRTPKGEPSNFLTLDELRAKFESLAQPYLGSGADVFADAILALEEAVDVRQVLRAARPKASVTASSAGPSSAQAAAE